jgi:four helix bundle protein
MLDYEKLDVYRVALEFVIITVEVRDRLPRGSGELLDQFKRASFSIVLNIAEGAGKVRQADKQRYFAIARGSAMECGALLDLFQVLHQQDPNGPYAAVVPRWLSAMAQKKQVVVYGRNRKTNRFSVSS